MSNPNQNDEQRNSKRPYSVPTLKQYGSIAEITKGGIVGPDDGTGGSGLD